MRGGGPFISNPSSQSVLWVLVLWHQTLFPEPPVCIAACPPSPHTPGAHLSLCRKPLAGNQETLRRQGSASGKAPALSLQALKHIWVRTALMEKVLDKVVQYLVENCR